MESLLGVLWNLINARNIMWSILVGLLIILHVRLSVNLSRLESIKENNTQVINRLSQETES